ncbi:GYF_domain [Hexamita inflata]|uniref:GYF domain n=1 Tax=Hexamita inflata TaxID=28002 RepID=A0AA86QZA0_9EUKA|nr:GYF domain [Hexamita inflata]
MSRSNQEKPNEISPQNEDVERFSHKIQINTEKSANQNTLNQNVEEIAAQVTAQVSTKEDAPKPGNDEAHKSKTEPRENNVKLESKEHQQTQNIQNANPESKDDNQDEPKENDSEPETKINEKANQEEVEIILENENDWYYLDLNDQIQGPFSTKQMNKWNSKGKLFENMLIKRGNYSFRLQKEQQYLPLLFKDQKEKVKKELVDLPIENKHEDDFKKNEEVEKIQIEVGTNAQMKQNVTKKDPQIEIQLQITKNSNIPKETNDVENPEAENNVTAKPKTNKTNLFGDDFYNYDLTYEPVKTNQPQQSHQAHENNNTGDFSNTQTSAQSYSTHYESQQQQTQQQVKAQEKQRIYEQNNESINYHPFDDSIQEEESHESQQKSVEQVTNSPTDSKWTQGQQKAFEASIFEVIKQYFDIEFQTLREAILHHRMKTISPEGGNATRIHLNFKKIASDNKITEKECNHKFQTLQANTLNQWPEEVVAAVQARVVKLWKELQEPDISERKKQIKATIEQEFHLKQQVQYNYKQITNAINYILRNLK